MFVMVDRIRGRSKDKMNKKSPTNTATEITSVSSIFTALELISPGAIERMEGGGQEELVNSDVIPWSYDVEKPLKDMGIILGEVVPGDALFRYATLPPGWKKVGTDHSMWSKIVDENGKERCSIFYKASFYDRKAHISITNP
jgi:hypothetical protein